MPLYALSSVASGTHFFMGGHKYKKAGTFRGDEALCHPVSRNGVVQTDIEIWLHRNTLVELDW